MPYVEILATGIVFTLALAALYVLIRNSNVSSNLQEPTDRLSKLEQEVEKLKIKVRGTEQNWIDYHTRIDSVVRRGIRLGVLAEKDAGSNAEPAPEAPPMSRSQLVTQYRRKRAGVTPES